MCFNLNFSKNPDIHTLDNVIRTYHDCIENDKLTFSGPTKFGPLINKVISRINKEDIFEYHILMILTDGVLEDLQETIDILVDASLLPLSVIIIGIGDADFSQMDILDGDETPLTSSKGKKRKRDIVQFVPFNKYQYNIEKLSMEVLAEIPRQIVEYYQFKDLNPEKIGNILGKSNNNNFDNIGSSNRNINNDNDNNKKLKIDIDNFNINNKFTNNNNVINNKNINDNKNLNNIPNGGYNNIDTNNINIKSYEYEGQLKNNEYDGKGIYYYKGGDRYEGEYKNDKKEGRGIYYYKEGDIYEGEYKNDKREGKGIYYYHDDNDGLKYEGDWKNGVKEGKGVLTLKNGDRYEGDFKNDNFEGRGIYYYNNGDIYEGEFKNDEFDGKGIFYYNDGTREMGDYQKGEPIGKHIKLYENGEIESIEC